jgi:antirestriction protein ArdC
MKTEQAREMTEQGLNRLAADLEQGKSEELTRFLSMMARFHRYGFGNIMLIQGQRPEATRVAGYNTWRSLGRQVRKGEKGITIVAPMVFRDEHSGNGKEDTVVRFKATHVFDVSQTEGEPLPEPRSFRGDPGHFTERLRALVASHGIALSYEQDLGSANGRSFGGKIEILANLEPAEEFAVMVHEFAHELLHQGETAVRGDSATRETEAEAVAFVVGHAVGLDAGTSSSDYIQLHRGDRKVLEASLGRIQHTACEILTALFAETVDEIARAA